MRSLLPKKFVLISFVALSCLLILISGYIYFVYIIISAAGDLRGLRYKIVELEGDRTRARLMKQVLETREHDFGRVSNFLVQREQPIDFIEFLDEIKRQTTSSVAVEVGDPKEDSAMLTFRLVVEGKQKNIEKYISLLELMPYEIRVEEIQFQKVSAGENLAAARIKTAGGLPDSRLNVVIKVKTRS